MTVVDILRRLSAILPSASQKRDVRQGSSMGTAAFKHAQRVLNEEKRSGPPGCAHARRGPVRRTLPRAVTCDGVLKSSDQTGGAAGR